MKKVFEQIKGGLVVSCQGLEQEPMHSSFIMGRFARAAAQGGAVGIRANTPEDIAEIQKNVSLPIIGIIKKDYPDSPVYITPTMAEIKALVEVGADIIALDATDRVRPGGKTLREFVAEIRATYGDIVLMADTSTEEEARAAAEMGFDCVGTTMRGYTPYTEGVAIPDFDLIERLAKDLPCPVIAEGGIWEPWQLNEVLKRGAFAAVVGGAITRPQNITRRFVSAIEKE